jgi:Ca2+-binding EF-hand superfamily protein
MRVCRAFEKVLRGKCGSMSRVNEKNVKLSDGIFGGRRLMGISGDKLVMTEKENDMKTPVLMAAIVAGLGLLAVSAQAQERRDFATLDANGDGSISMSELQEQGEQRFAATDTDGNGALSEAELLAQATERSENRAAKMVERMLERLDENNDGEIQQSELPERNGNHAERMFEHADANEDGAISEEEFDAAAERGGKRGVRGERHGGRG